MDLSSLQPAPREPEGTGKPPKEAKPYKGEREGMERALVYKTAFLTGIRRGELARLTWGDLDLDSAPLTLRVQAQVAKNGREAHQIVRADLEADLRAWKALNPQAGEMDPIFNVPERINQELKKDLAAAEILERDVQDRVFDFHSLRHCTATYLHKGKVAPGLAQAVMRYADIRLTMQTYTDLQLMDKGAALDALPALPSIVPGGAKPQAQVARATGTDGRPTPDSGALPYKGAYKRPFGNPQPVGAAETCMVGRPGIEPGTPAFSEPCSTS